MKRLSIIIVSYNVRDYLYQCLDSVMRAIAGIDAEVFVVDNNSTDSTVGMIADKYPQAKIIANHSNPGFSKANNQAIRISEGEYILLLNPDTLIGEGLIRDFLGYMDSHPEAGAAAAKMLKQDGGFALESRRGIPTPWTAFCKMSGLGRLFPKSRRFGRYYMQYLDKDSIAEIEIISGACMFLRRTAIEKVGLLDEAFFMYGEDIDLSYRILKAGYKNIYIPSPILHYKGESTHKSSYRYVNAFYSAMLIFFKKHFGRSILLSLPVRCAIYAKGFTNYVWQQLKKGADTHDTLYYIRKSRFLLLGSDANIESMARKCEEAGLNYEAMTVDKQLLNKGHHATQDDGFGFDYIVYDMSVFTYQTMLCAFERTASKQPSPMIATYHSDSDKIITGSLVI